MRGRCEKRGRGRVRWMIGRERSSSSRSLFSSIRSSSSSPFSFAAASNSSLKSTKPTSAGRIGSVAPFFRFPFRGSRMASVI